MINQKGQESAPFELLIAVILMTFVMFIGLQAMNHLAAEKCLSQAESELQELKTNLERVVVNNDSVNFSFYFPSCAKNEEIELQVSDNERYCSSHCGGTRRSCTLLKYSSDGQSISPKCVNIPEYVEFKTDEDECIMEGHLAVNLKEGFIDKGNYIMRYRSAATGHPEVCVFLKN